MRLVKIEAENLKGKTFSHDIEPVAFFTGPNGWGKTTRLQAVEAALRDFHGTPPYVNGDAVKVRLTFDTPLVVERRFSGGRQRLAVSPGDRGGVRENQAYLEQVLGLSPEVWDLGEFLGLSATGRVEYLAKAAGRAVDMPRDEVLQVLDGAPDEIRSELEGLWIEGMDVLTWIEAAKARLKELYTHYNRRQKEAKAALGQFAVAGEVAAQELARLKQDLAALRKEREEVVRKLASVDAIKRERLRLEETLQQLKADINELEGLVTQQEELSQELIRVTEKLKNIRVPNGEVKEAQNRLEELRKKREEVAARRQVLREKHRDLTSRIETLSGGVCPVCGASGEHVRTVLEQTRQEMARVLAEGKEVASDLAELERKIQDLNQQIDDLLFERDLARTERNKLLAKQEELTRRLDEARKARARLGRLKERKERLEAELENTPEVQDTTVLQAKLQALDEQIRQKETLMTRYEEARAQGLAYERTLEDARRAEQAFEAVKAMKKALKSLQQDVLARAIKPVEDAANELLEACEEDFTFKVDLSRPNIGLQRGNLWIPYEALSGSEQALAGAALVYALSVVGHRPWKVLLLDGVEALDDERLPRFVRGIVRLTEAGRLDNAVLAGLYRPQWGLWSENTAITEQ